MANACDEFLRRLSDSVQCPVCFMILDKPRSLPCGHTFCLDCIRRVGELLDDDFYYDEYIDFDSLDHRQAATVPCPVCRSPFSTPVEKLPVNFVVQNVIIESLQSTEVLCQSCCKERRLEAATVRCQDCPESLCDTCASQHAVTQHRLESLVDKLCDKHQQKLELYCFQCETNVCITCLAEDHQNHKYDAISKLAKDITEHMTVEIERLHTYGSRVEAVLAVIVRQKKKYEKYVLVVKECLKKTWLSRQQLRVTSDAFKSEKSRKNATSFIRTKLKAINAIIQLSNNGETIDSRKARTLVHEIDVLLGVLLIELSSQEGRLQKFVDDVKKLKTKASDIRSRLTSAYDLTSNSSILRCIDEEIKVLLQDCSIRVDPYLISVGTGDKTVPLLSSEGHKEFAELLQKVEVLRDLLLYEQVSESSAESPAISSFLARIHGRQQQQQQHHHGNHQQRAHDAQENPYIEPSADLRRRPPAVLPKPRAYSVNACQQQQQQQVPVTTTPSMSPFMNELQQRVNQRAASHQSDSSTASDNVSINSSTEDTSAAMALDDDECYDFIFPVEPDEHLYANVDDILIQRIIQGWRDNSPYR